jgi:hypothetical protein
VTTADDKFITALAAASLETEGLLAPWGLWCGTVVLATTYTVTTTVTATVRVVCGIHNYTTNGWADALVA